MSMTFQGIKSGIALYPVSTTSGATATSDAIDTLGYDELQVQVLATTSNAATNNFSVMKLQTCDTSGGTYANLSGYVGDTDFTIADAYTAATSAKPSILNVDLRGKARYFKCILSPTTTQTLTVSYSLGRPCATPVSASASGAENLVNPS